MKSIVLLVCLCLLSGLLFSQSSFQDIQNWASGVNKKISSSDVVEFVNESKACNEITYGNDAYFDTQPTEMTDITCLDSNRFVVVYKERENDEWGFAAVGIISGMNITFGPKCLFNSEETIWPLISTLDSNRVIVSYADQVGLSYNTKANTRIGEVIGDSIVFGDEFVYLDNMFWCFYHRYTVEALNPNLFIISFVNYHMSGHGTSIIGRIQNDSISFSQAYSYVHITPISSDPLGRTAMTRIDTNKFIVTYSSCDTAFYTASRFGTIQGDSVAFGPECRFQTGIAERLVSITLDPNHIITAYVDAANDEKGTLVKGTVNGDSISFSQEYLFYPDWTTWLSATALDETSFIVTCWDWVNNIHHGTACVGEVIGDTIFFGPFKSFSPDYCFTPEAGRVDSERFIMAYSGVWYDYPGTAVIGKIQNENEQIITSIDSTKTCPGNVLSSVRVQNIVDIGNFSLTLTYDTNNMEFAGALNIHPLLQADTLFITDDAGQVNLYWESPEGVSINNDTLCDLLFIAYPHTIQTTQYLHWDSGSYYLDTAGFYYSCEYIDGQIILDPVPGQPQMPQGPQIINLSLTDTSEYTIHSVIGADNYNWQLLPPESGSISGYDTTGIVIWDTTYLGLQAFIFVNAINECGESISDSLIVNIIPVSIPQIILKESVFRIAPNPSKGIFTLYFDNSISGFDLLVINLQGKTVYNQKIKASTQQIQINLSHVKSGSYFFRLINDEMNYFKRIIILN